MTPTTMNRLNMFLSNNVAGVSRRLLQDVVRKKIVYYSKELNIVFPTVQKTPRVATHCFDRNIAWVKCLNT